MNKDLGYYLSLNYPIAISYTDEVYEVWYPDFGRGAISALDVHSEVAIHELRRCLGIFIEYCIEHQLEIPEPQDDSDVFSGHFMVRASKELHLNLAKDAYANNQGFNAFVVGILENQKLGTE